MLLAAISFHMAVVLPECCQSDTAEAYHKSCEKYNEYHKNSNHHSTPAQLRAMKQTAA